MKAVRPGEFATLGLSFLYFLLLLASYYVLRPVRDGLVAAMGADHVKILNLIVLVVMLMLTPVFGWLMARIPRALLLPRIYTFCILNLLIFAFAMANPSWQGITTRVFFVWVMVFNMFVVSVFWSFMADIWNEEQARRLFGTIAAGGSIGGLVGPALANAFAESIGNSGLTLLSATLLSCAMACLIALSRRRFHESPTRAGQTTTRTTEAALGGSSIQSILLVLRSPFLRGIAILVCVTSIGAQFAYIETARLANALYESGHELTEFYSRVDFATNAVTLIFQAVVVGFLTTRFGIKAPLLGIAIIGCLSFIPVGLSPTIAVLATTTVIRRASEYGLGKPGRDMLYAVTTPQEKYLAKNVIDTLVYRSSDSIGNLLHTILVGLGFALAGLSAAAGLMLAGSTFVAWSVAKTYNERARMRR